ncbi:MAG: filamentous hemagglutinin N-terminal domain-containing protein [Cyanothece sp. SIO2G6]|nr:filamentous hemagglutinin N-terminal domain-containing protein [Cyanothece sp. SIO2G6]
MSLRFGLIIAAVVLVSPPVVAQIQPDGTVGSQVRVEGDRWVIEGGAQRGSALFHSFEQFNVGRTPVYFRGLEAEQIFGRVTGGARSRINGTLGVEGLADLFLINPNGILFGPEAQLDINGSFVAATANGMVFDNYEFSANEPNEVPLLTIRGPVGLRYAQPTAPIQVVGSGHNLRTVDDLPFTPFIDPGATEAGFSVAPGESIALLGGQINVTGGVIAARSGNIVLGAIESGNLTLDDFRPVYAQNVERGNIQMDESALLNVSGLGGGSIHLLGNRVGIRNGSYVLNQNSGTSAAGFLEVDAAILTIEGLAPGRDELDVVRSGAGLRGFTSIGAGSHIQIEADRLNLINGGGIGTSTYGVGSGGDINLAVGSLSILGTLNILNGTPSYIQSLSLGSGDGGDILIVASDTVRLVDGGFLGSNVSFIADRPTSGDITITAGSLQVIGRNPNSRRRSIVFTGSNLETVSGDVSVRANSIEVRDGAFLGSYSFGLGTPGDVNLSADNILVSGFSEIPSPTFANDRQPNVRILTRELESPARLDFSEFRSESHLDRTLVASLFISDFNEVEDLNVSNTSGNIQIDSRSLIVRDQAFITAVNGTSGEAGGIEIDTDTLILDEGGISADLIQLGRNAEANFGGNIEQGYFILKRAFKVLSVAPANR